MASRLKFLIVEDEFVSRILLKELLLPFGECLTACNGNEAVDMLRRSCEGQGDRFDLVCLDIMMPGKNGHEVLRELRRIEAEKGFCGREVTKVFMVTSLDDSKNIIEALVVGRCEAYLTKPVSRNHLEEHLRSLSLIDPVC
jgi:two-component system chemotaxis response regulator CheY